MAHLFSSICTCHHGAVDTRSQFDQAAHARILLDELQLLWVDDYYDGPLSGMLTYRNRLHRYECPDGPMAIERRYVIRELSDEEIADEQYWHELFVRHVGDHMTFRNDGQRGAVRPSSEHSKFYEPYGKRTTPDYSMRPIVGWFKL